MKMNGRLNWKDILVILGVLIVIIGSQWGFSSNLRARIDSMDSRIDRIETDLSAQGKALSRLDPYYPTPGPVNGG